MLNSLFRRWFQFWDFKLGRRAEEVENEYQLGDKCEKTPNQDQPGWLQTTEVSNSAWDPNKGLFANFFIGVLSFYYL